MYFALTHMNTYKTYHVSFLSGYMFIYNTYKHKKDISCVFFVFMCFLTKHVFHVYFCVHVFYDKSHKHFCMENTCHMFFGSSFVLS
jgi:hypothetical protein